MKSTLEKLSEFVKPFGPRAHIKSVEKKIGILRSPYNREHNLVQESQRSSAAADDIYVPRLWYYTSLRLLSDQTEA
ncbi:hypothetical protein AB205_0029680, partial [Aquarana catesbeiana]